MLWRRIGKDCGWEHQRAPAARWLWDERVTGAVLEFLEGVRAGCRASARAVSGLLGQEGEGEGEDGDQKEKRGTRAHPRLYFPLSFLLLILPFDFTLFDGQGGRRLGCLGLTRSGLGQGMVM